MRASPGWRSVSSSIRCTEGICTRRSRQTVRAPIVLGPAAALEYRNILVPVAPGRETQEALDVACRLATERRARVVALVAWSRCRSSCRSTPTMPQAEAEANELLDYARTIGDSYGVDVDRAHRPRPARRPRDRARGRAAEQRDHRHGRAARAGGRRRRLRRDDRLRARSTRPAACWSSPRASQREHVPPDGHDGLRPRVHRRSASRCSS